MYNVMFAPVAAGKYRLRRERERRPVAAHTFNGHRIKLVFHKYCHLSQIQQCVIHTLCSVYVQYTLYTDTSLGTLLVLHHYIQHGIIMISITGNAVAAAKGELWMGRTNTAVNGEVG